ncbi:MAG: cob(I)yrinic acid a,c-diamide adenosyltransferase [Burkholderiales bacterium]|nr:cob(I)yrinic acid a,c-diamide adenosyltransferase [Burkholderiales bacterium]
MGNRLSRIVTRTGDAGTTGLADGSRVSKDSPRIQALGDVDELNSAVGVLLAETLPDALRGMLLRIQHDLFDVGGELCIPGHTSVTPAHVERVEAWLDDQNAGLEPLANFILPGGTRAAGLAHLARAVCRRAERSVVALGAVEEVAEPVRKYLNRLSDLLFVLGRALNRHAGTGDVLWQQAGRSGHGDVPQS